jgi:fructose/tagatose bisphosphate aldolase
MATVTPGLLSTAELLEELRDQLQADAVTAQFGTRHGVVELRAERDRFRVLVDGQEVPQREGS